MTYLLRKFVDEEIDFTLAQNLLKMLQNQDDLLLQQTRTMSQKLGRSLKMMADTQFAILPKAIGISLARVNFILKRILKVQMV